MMRWLAALVFLVSAIGAVCAQPRPQGYAEAQRAFDPLTVDERIKLQMLTRALPPADRAERAKRMSVLMRCE